MDKLPPPVDGVVGIPVVFELNVQDGTKTFECRLTGSVKGPNGEAVEFTPTAIFQPNKKLRISFVPITDGPHTVEALMPESERPDGRYTHTIYVAPAAAAPATVLPRPCQLVSAARGVITCDDEVFTPEGTSIAVLDGGVWFGEGDTLFAWRNETLSTATLLTNGRVSFGPAVAAPFPESWSIGGALLGVSGPDGGTVYTVDAGTLNPVSRFEAMARITLRGDGTVFGNVGSALECSGGSGFTNTRISANDRFIAFYWQNLIGERAGAGCCEWDPAADAGFVRVGNERCLFPATDLHASSGNRNFPRRPMAKTNHGLRLATGGTMFLAGAVRSGSTDDIAWQSSDTETAIWR